MGFWHQIKLRVWHLWLAVTFLGAFIYQPAPASAGTPASVSQLGGRFFYVSRAGNNADGLSWATAWSELSNINWPVLQPGDTILLDGGGVSCPSLGPGYNCGMVYNSTLSITRSGTNLAPITIRLASEAGHNGTAIIDGGITAWAGCAENTAEPRPPSTPGNGSLRDTGVNFNSAMWVVLDGTKWGGIEIRNHTRYGVNFAGSQHATARYLKVHHNTDQVDTTNNAVGVTQNYLSAYNTLARSEVFRNGQDALRGAGDYFTVEESYIHDQYCNHPDGIQSFVPTSNTAIPDDAGEVRGLVVRRNVFDHIGMQTIFLGENATHQSWNVDVTIHDNLFLNNDYVIKSKHGSSTNWTIYNNTFVRARDFGVEWCCSTPGARAPMVIRDNVFSEIKEGLTAFYLPTGNGTTSFTNNCLYRTGARVGNFTESGTVFANPLFVDSTADNFALAGGSPCAGKGSAITSVSQLLALTSSGGVAPQATSTPALGAAPTSTSVPPTATSIPPTATNIPPTATATPAAGVTTSLTIRPAADGYVDATLPNTSYGTTSLLRTDVSPGQRSHLRFDVSGLAGRPVLRATFRIYANGYNNTGFNVYRVPDTTWAEGSLTYANQPALGSLLTASGAYGGARYVNVDVTGLVTGDGHYGIALTTTDDKAVGYPSREATSNQPALVLELGSAPAGINPAPTATNAPPTATSLPPTVTSIPPTATSAPPTATPAPVVTLTYAPAADAYVCSDHPNVRYGNSEIIRTWGTPQQVSFVRFDVTGVNGQNVRRALLRVYANGSSNLGFEVHRVNDNNWPESVLTYRKMPATNGLIGTSGAHASATWVTVDVTSYIRGDGAYSLALLSFNASPVSYPSREAPQNQPLLVLEIGN